MGKPTDAPATTLVHGQTVFGRTAKHAAQGSHVIDPAISRQRPSEILGSPTPSPTFRCPQIRHTARFNVPHATPGLCRYST